MRGPQTMTALRAATACLPDHFNDEALAAQKRTEWGVGVTLGGVIAAYMPEDFAGKTTEEKTECCWNKKRDELLTRCAEKVTRGEADLLLAQRSLNIRPPN